jgi:glycerophosphoryl diester phosphodiesterase
VCETRDAQLRMLDAGAHQHPAFAGEPMPTLAAAAHACRQLGLSANVEIKPAAGFEALTGEVVARQVRTLWAGAALPLVSSFSETALAAARAACPNCRSACSTSARRQTGWPRQGICAQTLHCAAEFLDDDLLCEARAAGIPVLCYTVNDPLVAAALLRRGVTAVFSDRIDCVGED